MNAPINMPQGNPKRANYKPLPAEGEDGLFSQTWFPVALSTQLEMGQVLGIPFLDGKIVLMRGTDGAARAMSAYCPHVGADLSLGKVIGDNLQCAFHHWEYDVNGQCAKTGIGDPPPRSACLYMFPIRERYGIIWVFNGDEPLFELPDLPFPEEELEASAYWVEEPFQCDPWVFAANTPDMQHLKVVHKIQFGVDDPHDLVNWHEFGLEFSYAGLHQGGVTLKNTAGIRGNSIFYRWGIYDDFWRASVTAFGLPRPGQHIVYSCNLVKKGPDAQRQLDITRAIGQRTVNEDRDILNTIHYRQGVMTKGDTSLAKFFSYLRKYPRAHPSAPFIN